MLEYQKIILQKVSFSTELFKKELKKSYKWLTGSEIDELNRWIEKQFSNQYQQLIPVVVKEMT